MALNVADLFQDPQTRSAKVLFGMHSGTTVTTCGSACRRWTKENELEWIKDRDTQLLMDGLMTMETAEDVRLLHKFISQSKDASESLDVNHNLSSLPSSSGGKKSTTSNMLRDYVKRKVHDRLVSKGMISKQQERRVPEASASDNTKRHNLKKALYRKIESRIQTMRAEGTRFVMRQLAADGGGR
eukprot:585480-Hanusia_phi.AAC.1